LDDPLKSLPFILKKDATSEDFYSTNYHLLCRKRLKGTIIEWDYFVMLCQLRQKKTGLAENWKNS